MTIWFISLNIWRLCFGVWYLFLLNILNIMMCVSLVLILIKALVHACYGMTDHTLPWRLMCVCVFKDTNVFGMTDQLVRASLVHSGRPRRLVLHRMIIHTFISLYIFFRTVETCLVCTYVRTYVHEVAWYIYIRVCTSLTISIISMLYDGTLIIFNNATVVQHRRV